MKKLLTLFAIVLSTSIAKADGFKCETLNGDLNISVYNQINPLAGTRNAASLIISDPEVSLGRKTVARFFAEEGTLFNIGSKYFANVDERFNNIPKGESLLTTKIDFLKSIILDIDFSYSDNVDHGDLVDAWLILNRENGTQIKTPMQCSRYTKHN